MPTALVLHDVYGPEGPAATGFAGASAARYKLSLDQFTALLDGVAASGGHPAADLHRQAHWPATSVALTFDDGGAGAALHTADLLEARGWHGYFLLVTDLLGQPGFLTPAQVRELHARGHIIGTHTRTHPIPIWRLAPDRIGAEWSESRMALEDLLGGAVEVGSVPGGFYSSQVGLAADGAGIRLLFTSEPIRRVAQIGGCRVVGRYSVLATTPPGRVAALLRGDPLPRLRAWSWWNLKKLPKSLAGPAWLSFRKRLLDR